MAVDQVREATATVHLLTEKVDQGDILAQNARPIDLGLTEKQLARIAIDELGALLVDEVLGDFEALKQTARPQICANQKPPTRHACPNGLYRMEVLGRDATKPERSRIGEGSKSMEKHHGRCYYCLPEGDIEFQPRLNPGGLSRSKFA